MAASKLPVSQTEIRVSPLRLLYGAVTAESRDELLGPFRSWTAEFHRGAASIFALLAATPFARETRETMDPGRTLEDSIRVFAEYLGRVPGPGT